MSKNNIELIESFISNDEDKTLLINQVSEEIYYFYEFVIKNFTNKSDIKISYKAKPDDIKDSNELFESKELAIFNLNNTKLIEEIASRRFQKIIFTDYKNYKKLIRKYIVVNGYDFVKDLKIFFSNYFDINNENLINFCISQPYLIQSELSKYQINSHYSADTKTNDTFNFILQIRKEIFIAKKSGVNIKELFMKLKNEVKYKKFSFLTY